MKWIESGDPRSGLWLVGEAPGEQEIEAGQPFRGASGVELDKMLREAGLQRSDCFATNVCHIRPPTYWKNGRQVNNDIEQFFLTKTAAKAAGIPPCAGRYPSVEVMAGLSHLREILATHRPRLVLALGNTALWACTGHSSITKWRGSTFDTVEERDKGPAIAEYAPKVVCTFHPTDVLHQWFHRPVVLHDLRRAKRELEYPEVRRPKWNFSIPATIGEVRDWFGTNVRSSALLVCDTEGWGRVDCIGFASSQLDAICIPFKHETPVDDSPEALHYWTLEQEEEVTSLCQGVLTSHDIIFHNAVWDCQVIARRWGFLPRLGGDTQAKQHVAFPGLVGGRIDPVTGTVAKGGSSLSLAFIASMYCDYYRYWKDDGRHFDPTVGDEVDYWHYNCEDCVRTFEASERLDEVLAHGKLIEQYQHVLRSYGPVLAMMFRGLRYDREAARSMREQIISSRDSAKRWLDHVTCTNFNPNSHTQCKALFYDDLALPRILNRKTKAVTLDDTALERIARSNPLTAPLVKQIQNYRTLDTVKADVDPDLANGDGVLRFGLNPAFVETFRFSSGETAWGEGGNVQNIKRPDEE